IMDRALGYEGVAAVIMILDPVLHYPNWVPNYFVWDDRPFIAQDYPPRSPRYTGAILARDFFSHSMKR
ncbi:MAG: hypothetical protein SVR04_16755, partial [Spirochaetota bacterium]|nr:hypothetical protein [Spirochaetota bacterium]